jgi:Domain of unknown function (DUF5615)
MRVLLDANLPRQLKQHFSADVEVLTVQERGWSGIKNSELLRLAAGEFDVFLFIDNLARGATEIVFSSAGPDMPRELRAFAALVQEP